MNRKTLSFVIAMFLAVGFTVNASAQTYTADLSWSSQSAFKLFGSTASTRPIGALDVTVEKGSWSAELIVVRGIGDQNQGEQADYYDGFITRSWESGKFSGSYGTEIFHAPAQLGGPHATFIGPLAKMTWKYNDHFSMKTGVQYVGTYNTDYGGDRIYGWVQPTFSVGWWRLSLDVSPGYIAGNTGRTTQYLSSTLSLDLRHDSRLYVSYLQAESWGTGEPGMVPIDGTWTGGVTITFNNPNDH